MDLEEQRRAVETSFLSNLHPDDAPRHPLYAALCDLAGQTPQVIDMMLEVEPTQRRAVLFLAVLHDMALREPAGPVGGHYPTAIFLAGLESGMDVDTARDTAAKVEVGHSDAQAILQFALDHDDELIDAMRVRRTQTNEVGRSGLLMLGLQVIGRGEPTALIDLGCSAGLNLVAPSYRHVRTDGVELGEPTSKVVVPVDVRHGRGPTAPVDLVWAGGIDLDPVDLADQEAARWLLACQWPDDLDRFERTRQAIAQWSSMDSRPEVKSGDLVEELPRLVDAAPSDARLVIHHSWVVSYLTVDQQVALRSTINDLRRDRPIDWLYLEHPSGVPGLQPPRSIGDRRRGSSLFVLDRDDRGPVVLGQAHPHGTWIALDGDWR